MKLFSLIFISLHLTFGVSSTNPLITLTEDTWSDMLKGEWVVEFYAPWCPACRGMQSIWEEFAGWSHDLHIEVAQIDVTKNPGLSGRFLVTALPTFYHIKDGVFRQYKGPRGKDDLIAFIDEKKWEQIEPVPSWKAPQSIPMSFVGQFFKLSMVLRSIHNEFVDNYGIPYWGSYIIFAIGTIFCGTILGLFLVCIIDYVFPSKPLQLPVGTQELEKNDKLSTEKTTGETSEISENEKNEKKSAVGIPEATSTDPENEIADEKFVEEIPEATSADPESEIVDEKSVEKIPEATSADPESEIVDEKSVEKDWKIPEQNEDSDKENELRKRKVNSESKSEEGSP